MGKTNKDKRDFDRLQKKRTNALRNNFKERSNRSPNAHEQDERQTYQQYNIDNEEQDQ